MLQKVQEITCLEGPFLIARMSARSARMNIVSSGADRRRHRRLLCRFVASSLKKKNKRVLYCRRGACRDCCVFCNKSLETLLLLLFVIVFSLVAHLLST
jgi:hypothetical protein